MTALPLRMKKAGKSNKKSERACLRMALNPRDREIDVAQQRIERLFRTSRISCNNLDVELRRAVSEVRLLHAEFVEEREQQVRHGSVRGRYDVPAAL